jgi:dihydroneopterin aldolase
MALISLENMEFFSYHGCFAEEQLIGTRFLVTLIVETDTSDAAMDDDLHKTINYVTLFQITKKEMDEKSKLLENVSLRILTSIMEQFPAIKWVKVKISKMNPPIGGKAESVSVTLTSDDL